MDAKTDQGPRLKSVGIGEFEATDYEALLRLVHSRYQEAKHRLSGVTGPTGELRLEMSRLAKEGEIDAVLLRNEEVMRERAEKAERRIAELEGLLRAWDSTQTHAWLRLRDAALKGGGDDADPASEAH